MSLLVPTVDDYRSAHNGSREDYHELIKDIEFEWQFEVVDGYFRQSNDETDDMKFRYTEEKFGIYGSWSELLSNLKSLNENAKPSESYKLIFFARHGQGYHNVVLGKYGIEEWHKKWRYLPRDGDIVYGPDPELTELGLRQAQENNEAWKNQISKGAPIPSKFYVSPLQRSCKTLEVTWNGIATDIKPKVDELLRETIGINLSDKRSTKSVIKQRFSQFEIDESMTEEDELFRDDYRESIAEQGIRAQYFLEKLFNEDMNGGEVDAENRKKNDVIYTASHTGTVKAVTNVVGHRSFTIPTGGSIPMVIRGTKK